MNYKKSYNGDYAKSEIITKKNSTLEMIEVDMVKLRAGDEEEKREPAILLSLAAQLQEAIKKDTHFQYTVRDHCRKLGYTTGHCRKLFTREMHLDPGEYRMRCRMERILSLLSGGSLTYKEIAFEVGMKHVTHLHSFVKKRTGKTLDSLADSLAR